MVSPSRFECSRARACVYVYNTGGKTGVDERGDYRRGLEETSGMNDACEGLGAEKGGLRLFVKTARDYMYKVTSVR